MNDDNNFLLYGIIDKDFYFKMENVFLTSFGVFLALLLKQPPKPTNLQISQAFDIQIEAKEPTPIVHDKKKKNKKKKHNEAKVEET